MLSKFSRIIARASFANAFVKRGWNTKYRGFKTARKLGLPVIPFKLADFGEGIREVTIKAVLVKVGDYVNQFDEVCQVESDKASVSVTSRYDGIVKKVYHDVGDVVLIGSTIIDIEIEREDDCTDTVSDDSVPVDNNQIGAVDTKVLHHDEYEVYADHKKALTTPAVRRIAMENKVNIDQVKGTGKAGRILKEDLLDHLAALRVKSDRSSVDGILPSKKEDDDNNNNNNNKYSDDSRAGESFESNIITRDNASKTEESPVVFTGYRKAMVKTMTESNKIPTAVLSDEFDLTKLDRLKDDVRKILKDCNDVNDDGAKKITLLPFFVKAVSLGLSRYPILNATYKQQKDSEHVDLIFNSFHNICLGIDTPSGLVAPNVKNVQNIGIKDISKELARLRKNALDGNLSKRDTSDGTFTLSNIGAIAGTVVKPLILPPQVSVGAIGRLQLLPRFDHRGDLVKSKIVVVSWSVDHRVIDGATLARFSNVVKRYLENPELFLTEL